MISICLVIALLVASSIGFQAVSSKRDFIIAELIHRDSYMSQVSISLKSTNPSSSGMILGESTKSNTSLDRINNFNSSSIHDINARDIESVVTIKGGAYFVKINTNGQEKLLLFLTTVASTLMFGEPCEGCHKQYAQRFLPSMANRENFPAESIECRLLRSARTVLPSGKCGDLRDMGLNALGVLSRVTSSFSGSDAEGGQFDLWFSRVFKSERDPLGPSAEGVVGLGPGPYSLITQLAVQLKIAEKFSYCLKNPYSQSSRTNSKIVFGEKTSISTGKVTTPFVTQYAKPFYYLSIRAITVGNDSQEKTISMEGHDIIKISSNIRTTLLPPRNYNDLVANIKSFMVDVGDVVPDAKHSLCYNNLNQDVFPRITLEFDNGKILKLPRANTYIAFKDSKDSKNSKTCMTIEPTKDGDSPLLGTHAQTGFEVEYDLHNSQISFTDTEYCDNFGIL